MIKLKQIITLSSLHKLLSLYLIWILYQVLLIHPMKLGLYPWLEQFFWPIALITGGSLIGLFFNRGVRLAYFFSWLFLVWLAITYISLAQIQFLYLSWMLFFLLAVSFLKSNQFHAFFLLKISFWVFFGLFYTLHGVEKLFYEPWMSGEIVSHMMNIQRPNEIINFFKRTEVSQILAWGAALGQVICLPLIPFKSGRWLIWTGTTLEHISIAIFTTQIHIALGMLLYQFLALVFLMNPNVRDWIPTPAQADYNKET